MIESGTPYPKLGWEYYCAHDEHCCNASQRKHDRSHVAWQTKAADADKYLEYLNQSGIPDYRRTPGNLCAWVFRRIAVIQNTGTWQIGLVLCSVHLHLMEKTRVFRLRRFAPQLNTF